MSIIFLIFLGILDITPALAAPSPPPVPACPPQTVQPLSLPHLRQALKDNDQLVIVAIGSSSTEGWMASDLGRSYPAQVQAMLNRALPQAHVAVINRGIGGQDAAEEVVRMQSDALGAKPQLVIWQVGANGALDGTDPIVFRKLVSAGVQLLHAAKADVILMDNQRAPALMSSHDDQPLDAALAEISRNTGASLFSRGAMMAEWQQKGWPYAKFISPDGLHHNDLGYRCLAESVTGSVLEGLKPTKGPDAKAGGASPTP